MARGAVVLVSTGLDSTVALAWAKQHYVGNVFGLFFLYEGQAFHEQECYPNLASTTGISIRPISLPNVHSETGLFPFPFDHGADFIPGRNIIFCAIAGAYAFKNGIGDVVTGLTLTSEEFDAAQEDEVTHGAYPDATPDFVRDMTDVLDGALHAGMRVLAPFHGRSKAEMYALAERYDVLDFCLCNSTSCTAWDKPSVMPRHEWGCGCGECEDCKERAQAYAAWRRGDV